MQLSTGGVAGTLFPCLVPPFLKKWSTNWVSVKGAVLKDVNTGNFTFENRCSMNLCDIASTPSLSANLWAYFSWVCSEWGCQRAITSPAWWHSWRFGHPYISETKVTVMPGKQTHGSYQEQSMSLPCYITPLEFWITYEKYPNIFMQIEYCLRPSKYCIKPINIYKYLDMLRGIICEDQRPRDGHLPFPFAPDGLALGRHGHDISYPCNDISNKNTLKRN